MRVVTSIFVDVLALNSTNMTNFHPLEVVDRGSETQFQVGENLDFQYKAFSMLMVTPPPLVCRV